MQHALYGLKKAANILQEPPENIRQASKQVSTNLPHIEQNLSNMQQ